MQRIPFFLFIGITAGIFLSLNTFWLSERFQTAQHPLFMSVSAEDDDEKETEDEDKEDEDKEDEDDKERKDSSEDDAPVQVTQTKKSKPKKINIIQEVVEYRSVPEKRTVTEVAYTLDTDGDALVDAIDPDPSIAQQEYFTDTDGDGMPNALDLHHDEDDFAYFEFEIDENGNGILDSYEN
jgi:FtsZ-interacting cell division protein ZipA